MKLNKKEKVENKIIRLKNFIENIEFEYKIKNIDNNTLIGLKIALDILEDDK